MTAILDLHPHYYYTAAIPISNLSQYGDTLWFSCDFTYPIPFPVLNVRTQCLNISVPLDWNNSTTSETISIFVRRIYADQPNKPNTKQLWQLGGGAAVPGSVLESTAVQIIQSIAQIFPQGSIDIYLYDKRGTGKSSWLDCTLEDFLYNFAGCITVALKHHNRIKHNTYTNTAKDLKYLIDLSAANNEVYVMGMSNGAYLAQRYLTIAPFQSNGIILDSFPPPDRTQILLQNINIDFTGLDIMVKCSQDNFCSQMFYDNNPIRALYELKMKMMHNGSICGQILNINYRDLSEKMSFCLLGGSFELIPAIIFRTIRCSPQDQLVLKNFLIASQPATDGTQEGISLLFEWNHNWSELWSSIYVPQLSCDTINEIDNTLLFTQKILQTFCQNKVQGDQAKAIGYPQDEYYGKYSNSTIPVIALHGELDQAIPSWMAYHAADQYSKLNPNFRLIKFPYTGHVPTGYSPEIGQGSATTNNCAYKVIVSFILNGGQSIDDTCTKFIVPFDFIGQTDQIKNTAMQFFNTTDLWGKPFTEPISSTTATAVSPTVESSIVGTIIFSITIGGYSNFFFLYYLW
ncbi:unnamed protein product [Didymodactylos carnosus]|uniref:Uncharacterized protein n=1 Tax=Didymodactylos carnosus TaxID=1234261 RepID=A0A814FX38_9BILA|nr:unnamed protein product [Didymodactylos carnosus]CAF1108589.1 unnamed protein product [Didymodactylos carnosus]CAF3758373.1 unnamed protein product [Didymodactylos carnosus]CAF3874455.1 unnamed protein product [Didymodactylos carnosus]